MAGRLKGFLLAVGSTALCGVGQAQLPDPTRPPADVIAPVPVEGEGEAAAQEAGSGLQSVILRKVGRPAALINGQVVELGSKLGDARLVRVEEDFVVLVGPQGRETLRLTPEVDKKLGADKTAKPAAHNAVKAGGAK